MNVCKNCGFINDDSAQFCSSCGSKLEESQQDYQQQSYYNTTQQSATSGTYYEPPIDDKNPNNPNSQYNQNSQNNQQYYQPPQQPFSPNPFQLQNDISTANVLGIISIITALIFSGLIGFVCGLIGKSKAEACLRIDPYNPNAIQAKKYNTIGIIIAIVKFCLSVLITFLYVIGIISLATYY